jgi:hypothetical protein
LEHTRLRDFFDLYYFFCGFINEQGRWIVLQYVT